MSLDPLTSDYPSWSPYPFAMNRAIDGVDLDGLEYLDADIAKVKLIGGTAFIKLENFSTIYQNDFRKRFPSYGLIYRNSDGTMHGNGELATVIYPEYSNKEEITYTKDGDIAPWGTVSTKAVLTKQRLDDKRVKTRTHSSVSASGRGRAVGFAILLNTVNASVEYYINYTLNKDMGDLARQTKDQNRILIGLFKPDVLIHFEAPFNLALEDLTNAINTEGIIPEQYMNVDDLSSIFNVILYGGDGNESEEILNIGNKIINTISVKNIQEYVNDEKVYKEKF